MEDLFVCEGCKGNFDIEDSYATQCRDLYCPDCANKRGMTGLEIAEIKVLSNGMQGGYDAIVVRCGEVEGEYEEVEFKMHESNLTTLLRNIIEISGE